ncbi:MAG TPA: hypothetical protein VNI55_02240 [Gaiellaceae bacterium]|nr:hypothetical protein [Gaiellaceae bacterium]
MADDSADVLAVTFRVYLPDECGKDGYPPEWHATIKHAVREAAEHRCIRCLHPYAPGAGQWSLCDEQCRHELGETRMMRANLLPSTTASAEIPAPNPGMYLTGQVEAEWRILTVHHLNGDKADCRWWNLVSLCQRCHLRVQRVVLMSRIWPWEHSEWFRPYVAGYYASVYLGEDITREEAVARLDELLALEAA